MSDIRALMLTPDEGHLDRRIAQEAASMASAGWTVDIVPTADPGLRYEGDLPPGVRLHATGSPGPGPSRTRRLLRRTRRLVAGLLPPVDRLVEAARYRVGDRASALADAHEDRLVEIGPYDLVVAHDAPVFPLAVRLRNRWGCPLVCDLHEVFAEQDEFFTTATARAYWRSVEQIGIRAADGIVCVNDAVADYARTTHAPTAECVVVHNSVPYVDPGRANGATLRDYYPLPGDARILLFAGSLRPHKNLEVLIEGFGQAGLDGWVLAVLGAGPLQATLESLVRRRGLAGRVFLGRRAPERELIAVASSADVGLLPYQPVGINYAVATPNKLFEYIQARLPIAASRLPMIERIIRANGNGDFVDFATAATTADGLRRFVAGPYREIRPAQLEAAARQYSWEADARNLLGLVSRVSRPAS